MPVSALSPSESVASVLASFQGKGRAYLLPCLLAVQRAHGWLSPDLVTRVGAALAVPVADIYGVIDFYTMLYSQPHGRRLLRVCDDIACYLAQPTNCESLRDTIATHTGLRQHGDTTPDGAFTLELMPCLGRCTDAPAVLLDETPLPAAALLSWLASDRDADVLPAAVETAPPAPVLGDVVLADHVGRVDPWSLADHEQRGGFAALRQALGAMTPAAVVQAIEASGLVGRGGAAFPTGVKWRSAADEPATPKMVVCNADESEPGTFKDRTLLQGDPYRLIEAMALAAYAIQGQGEVGGYIYLRGEYGYLAPLLENALARCREAGYLGQHLLGSDLHFDIELRLGAGAYICGEETALFESIEGKRGMPRIKPPFPVQVGLFGKPTVINNVETFFNIPPIVRHGPGWLRQYGTAQSPGTKLFGVSGCVQRPGLYELPLGRSLRHLLFDQAGGPLPDRRITSVLLGGAAGAFVSAAHFDVALDWQSLREIGATLGSGAVMVLDDRVAPWEVVRRVARFFAHESCGKCYPCQMGTQRQVEIVERLRTGQARPHDRLDLDDLAGAMRDASLCGLGQTASGAILSAVELFGG